MKNITIKSLIKNQEFDPKFCNKINKSRAGIENSRLKSINARRRAIKNNLICWHSNDAGLWYLEDIDYLLRFILDEETFNQKKFFGKPMGKE